jgi:hypothetical protein
MTLAENIVYRTLVGWFGRPRFTQGRPYGIQVHTWRFGLKRGRPAKFAAAAGLPGVTVVPWTSAAGLGRKLETVLTFTCHGLECTHDHCCNNDSLF